MVKYERQYCLKLDDYSRKTRRKPKINYEVITSAPKMEVHLIEPVYEYGSQHGQYPYKPYPGTYTSWWKYTY